MVKLISDEDFSNWLSNPDKSHLKHNYSATSAPGATNDVDEGYSVGSIWIDVSADNAYVCLDITDGAAVWGSMTPAAGDAWSDPVDAVITPDADGTRDLGTTGTRFATGYFDALTITNDGSGSGIDADLLDGVDSDEIINAGLSTGVVSGGVLSVGTPNTTFSITDGEGIIVDTTTDPANPTITQVTWTGKTNVSVTNLLTNLLTWVAIDSGGNVLQQTTRFDAADRRNYIILGVVVHVNKTIVDTVNNEQSVAGNVASQISDLMEGIGFVNKSGNVFSANGANLNVDKTAGEIMNHGVNWDVDPLTPHHKTLAALTALTFQYRFQDGTNGATGTVIDPDIYDVGGTSTTVTNNKFTVQRIYSFVSNNVKIQPGQVQYNNLADAKAAIQTENFITEPSIAANGLLRGFLVVKKGCTDLTNTSEAFFLPAGKFGEAATAGGLSVSTLQAAYNNSEVNPEVATTDTGGAFQIRRGTTGGDSDVVFEVQNSGGTAQVQLQGDGDIVMGGTGALHTASGTTAQRPGTPANGMFRYNSTDGAFEGYASGAWGAIGGGGSTPEAIFGGDAAAHSVNTTTAIAPVEYVDLGTIEVLVRAFDDTTEEYMQGSFRCPADIDTSGTVTFEMHGWSKTAAASKNIAMTFGHRAVADSEAVDGSFTDEDIDDQAVDATQGDLDIITWTETVSNLTWAAGDNIHYRFSRYAATTNNLSGDYYVWRFIIRVPRV